MAVLALGSGGALSSSYGGTGDWTIPAGTSEVVTNETVKVLGDVAVLGNLSFENSTLVVWGHDFPAPPLPPVPGLFIPGDVRVAANARLFLNWSTMHAYHAVNIAGLLSLTNSSFNISGDDGARQGPGITSGFFNISGRTLAVNSSLSVLGRSVVTGSLRLVSSSLIFGTDPYVNGTAPFGMVGWGTITLEDSDNSSATTADASVLGASGNGTYSSLSGRFVMRNSRGENLGEGGYPGLEFNRSQVTISGCTFLGPAGAGAGASLDGLRAAVVFNNVSFATVTDTSFAGVALPIVMRNGVQNRVERVNITAFVAGVQLLQEYYTEVNDLTVGPSFPMPGLASWPPLGTAIAVRNGSNITVQRLLVEGNSTQGQYQPLSGILAENVDDLVAEDVTVRDAGSLISAYGPGWLILNRVLGERVGGGVILMLFSWARLNEASVEGDMPVAFYFGGCQLVEFGNSTGDASVGVEIEASTNVFVRNVSVNVRQAGLRFNGDRGLTVSRLTVTGNGTGLMFVTADEVVVRDSDVEFGFMGLNALLSTDIMIQNVSFHATPAATPDVILRLWAVFRIQISQWSFAGSCGAAGFVENSGAVSIDRLEIAGCQQGLAVTSTSNFDLGWADLHGVTAGTALGFYDVTNAWVGAADLRGASGVGLAIVGSTGVDISSFNASEAGGADGVIIAQSRDIFLSDGDVLGAYYFGVVIVNATGPVTLTRLRINGLEGGVQVLDSPGVELVDCDISMNGGDGVNVDSTSLGVVLRNLTLSRNAGAGLRMDGAGASLIDGNISANGGEGISPGVNVRLDWHVEVAASFTDGRTRFTGDILVSPGASFVARRAAFHFDPGPRQMPLAPPPLINLGAGAILLFDAVTLDSTNQSAPYTLDFGDGASVEILGSHFEGSGRGQDASAIQGSADSLTIRNSTITAFTQPLAAFAGSVVLTDVNFTDNDVGPRLLVQRLTFSNLTVELSQGHGLEVFGVPVVSGTGLHARGNGGTGARFSNVADLVLDDSEAESNLQGGLLLESTLTRAQGLRAVANLQFGLRLQGGGRAQIEGLLATENTGAGVIAQDVDELILPGAQITDNGGRGLDLSRVAIARFEGGLLARNSAFGLVAVDVDNLTVSGARFDGNGVAQIVLQGWTVALFVDGQVANSPGDAVVLNGTASGVFVAVAGDALIGRISAAQNSYASLVNSTFPTPFVLDQAQVDVSWNVSAVVNRESGASVARAVVKVLDAQGSQAANEVTGTDGSTPVATLLVKSLFAGGVGVFFSPHLFVASLSSIPSGAYGGARALVDVDRYLVVNLTLDSTPPATTLMLEGAAGANGWFLGPVTARLQARDASGYGVTLFWRVAPRPWQNGTSAGNFTETAVAFDAEGEATLEYYAVDGVGNAEAVRSALVKIDLNTPTARFEDFPGNATGPEFWVRWNATDTAGSFCCSYIVERAEGDGPFEPWGGGGPVGALFTPDAEGTYHFRLTATDGAGRESRPVTGTLQVFLDGTVRISVTETRGTLLLGALVLVEGTNLSFAGAGPFDIRLAPGAYRITVSAPGFVPRTLEVHVEAHNVTNLGAVELVRLPQAVTNEADQGPVGLLLLLISAGGAALIWFARRSRRKPL